MLAVWALLLTIIGLMGHNTDPADPEGEQTRLLLEGTTAVRSAYWAQKRSGAYEALEPLATGEAVVTMERLARRTNSPEAWRRLALTRYMLNAGDWRPSLIAMRSAAPPRPLAEIDRELAQWRIILERPVAGSPAHGRRQDTAVVEARSFIEGLGLGWFRYAALAALYENHGNKPLAEQYRARALRSTDRLTGAVLLVLLIALGGVGIWFTALLGRLALGRQAFSAFIARFDPLPTEAARGLTLAAAAYFAGVVLLRMLPGLLPQQALERLTSDGGFRSVVTALIVALSLAPPMLVLKATGFVKSIGLAGIGLVRLRPLRDVAVALMGHASLLPALALTLIISSTLFDPSTSRMNPAIEEFSSGTSAFPRIAMFVAGAVLAPLVEEIVFRGILLRALQAQLGSAAAIIVSSAVFAILHPQLPMGFLSIFVLGVGFALIYRITGSLWPAILAHAINNTLVFGYLLLVLAD